jgi:hypothetical protein
MKAFFRRHPFLTVWLAMAFVVLATALGFQHQRNDYVADQARVAASRRAAICSGFEAYTNSLITIGAPAKTPEELAAKQKRYDDFERDLEARLGPLECDLHLLRAR